MTKDSQTHAGVIKPGQKHTKTLAGTGADLESHAGVIVKFGQTHTKTLADAGADLESHADVIIKPGQTHTKTLADASTDSESHADSNRAWTDTHKDTHRRKYRLRITRRQQSSLDRRTQRH